MLSSDDPGSKFPREDFLADIDAVIIFNTLKNIQAENFKNYFDYHYNYNSKIRFSIIDSLLTYEEALEIVGYYLSYTSVVSLILVDEFNILLPAQRNAFRDAYVDYFWGCLENE